MMISVSPMGRSGPAASPAFVVDVERALVHGPVLVAHVLQLVDSEPVNDGRGWRCTVSLRPAAGGAFWAPVLDKILFEKSASQGAPFGQLCSSQPPRWRPAAGGAF